MRSGQDRI
jgi:hypothetical protein